MTTMEETETERIEAMLKRDAFGFWEDGEQDWLRDPENLDSVYSVLKVLYAKIESQVKVSANNQAASLHVDRDWWRKIQNLEARLRARVVEFDELYRQHVKDDLRSAIRRHRAALIASDGEPEPYDELLWSYVE